LWRKKVKTPMVERPLVVPTLNTAVMRILMLVQQEEMITGQPQPQQRPVLAGNWRSSSPSFLPFAKPLLTVYQWMVKWLVSLTLMVI
jgi:hypothetical protein